MSGATVRILPREHITEALKGAVTNFALTVLTAPMGYGKTTAARELMAALDMRVSYIRVTPGPHNAPHLWDMICGQLEVQDSEIAPILQRMGFPAYSSHLRPTLARIKSCIAGRPTLLVIDDYHLVTDPEMDRVIESMAREAIPGLCILVCSRTRPNLALEDLRIKGLAAIFSQDLLIFSEKEAIAYFYLHGVDNSAAASEARAFSEGWAAALWLSLQNWRTHRVLRPVRDVEALLSETIFSVHSAADRALLLQLSMLDGFTPAQAAAVSGNASAPRRLRALHNKNAFLSYDPSSDSYQLHGIFRAYLANRLAEQWAEQAEEPVAPPSGPKDIHKSALFRRAGEWFAAHDDAARAIRFFSQAGRDEDLLRILELFAVPGADIFTIFAPEEISARLSAIPWRIRVRCPVGWLAFVHHYISRVNQDAGLVMLKEAAIRFAGDESIPSAMKQRIAGEIELIHGIEAFNDLYAMRDRHVRAYELLQGRLSSISHPRLIWTFCCPHVSSLYLREAGSYNDLVRLMEENLHQYQELSGGCSAGAQALFRAELLLETGSAHAVEPHLQKAAYKATEYNQLSSLIAIAFAKARLRLAEGRTGQAQTVLRELAPQLAREGNPLLNSSFDLCQGYIAASTGSVEEIPPWLRQGDLASSRIFYQSINFARVVHAKALLAAGDWTRLEVQAEELAARLGTYRSLFCHIHALVLKGIAALHLRGQERAAKLLRQAVELARPDGIVCSIAEYGAHITPLLRPMWDLRGKDTYLALLCKYARRYTSGGSGPQSLLAPREQAILAKAMDGMSNKDIAEALCLAPTSVGTALSRIYAKLGVKNRAGAIKAWRAHHA